MSEIYDAVVIGGGVVGAATAFNLKKLGCDRVLLLERAETCSGGTAKSCAIIRTHYSIATNTELAVRSLETFSNFREALGDADADCGWVNSGYLILAPEGDIAENLTANLAMQAGVGAETRPISREEATELHPHLALDDIAAIGYEPRSGYADPYQTTQSYIRAAIGLGVEVKRFSAALGLVCENNRVIGVETSSGTIAAGSVVAAIGPWSHALADWTGLDLSLEISRHIVVTFGAAEPYGRTLPIVKDLTTVNKMYFRPATDGAVLVGTGDHGDPIETPGEADATVDMEFIAHQGAQLAHRMPSFADGEFKRSWTGPYDITPDWNPVLGPAPGFDGLHLAYGFSGHGFKLAPAVGRVLAQGVLGMEADIEISAYSLARFATGELLVGSYGIGSIS
jgi:glycine/D-amino acid oxidase-like deaminating enzyme